MPWTDPQETATEPAPPPDPQGEALDLNDPTAGLRLLATLVQLAHAQLTASERLIAQVEQLRADLASRPVEEEDICPSCERELAGVPEDAERCPHCGEAFPEEPE